MIRAVLLIVSVLLITEALTVLHESKCESITNEACRKKLDYNTTWKETSTSDSGFLGGLISSVMKNPTAETKDSIKSLCMTFFPMCRESVGKVVQVCKPICMHVKSIYEPILQSNSISWPKNCDELHESNGRDTMCMDDPDKTQPEIVGHRSTKVPAQRYTTPSAATTQCHAYKHAERYIYINRTKRCALRCGHTTMFNAQNQSFTEVWMSVWAGISFLCSLFTVLTFAIDAQRFHFPERSVLFLAVSCGLYSLGYIIRAAAGRSAISCVQYSVGESILIQEGLENTSCVAVFMLLYYFGMTAASWWVVLCLTWLLGLTRSHTQLDRLSSYFHLGAWLLPAVQTVVILVMRAVDGDELTGICYVGLQDQTRLLCFVIIPLSGYLGVGAILLLVTFLKVRKQNQTQMRSSITRTPVMDVSMRTTMNDSVRTPAIEQNSKHPKFYSRPAVLGLLYLVPTASVLACYIYEYFGREHWLRPGRGQPSAELFNIRIFASLAPGITMSLWIWSSKTWRSWQHSCARLCRIGSSTRKYSSTLGTTSFSSVPYVQPNVQVHYSANGSLSTVDSRFVMAQSSFYKSGREDLV